MKGIFSRRLIRLVELRVDSEVDSGKTGPETLCHEKRDGPEC